MDTGSCATPTCSPAKSLLRRHKKGLQSHGDQKLHYNQAISNLPCSSCQLHLPHRHGQRVSSAPRGTSHGLHRDLQLPQSCAHPELGTTHLRSKLSCPPTPWRRAKRHGERELRNTPHLSNLSCHSRYTQLPRNLAQRQPRTSRLLSNPSCPTLQMEVPKAPSTGASPHAPSLLALLPCHGSYRAGTRPQKKVSPPHPLQGYLLGAPLQLTPPAVDKESSQPLTTSLTSHFLSRSNFKVPLPVHRERSTPRSHSATSGNRTMPKALGKGSLAQARSTTCQRLLRELQIHMVRTQTQGRLAATSQRLPVWCKLPTSINTGRSATPATSLTRPFLDRHNKGLRGRGKEGRPTTQHLALGSLMVSTGPFHLPIPVSHPDKAPTRLLSNLSFSPRPPQRRNCYRQRDLGKTPQIEDPPRVEVGWKVPKASHHTFSL